LTLSFLTVGQVAMTLKTERWRITYLFDAGRLDVERCPVVAGRRLVPSDYLDAVRRELRRMKRIKKA